MSTTLTSNLVSLAKLAISYLFSTGFIGLINAEL
jgi:hypothetical protein